ncbi:MAG: hypothetical protein SGBAC_010524, partial [Bacillariaceae sp.]
IQRMQMEQESKAVRIDLGPSLSRDDSQSTDPSVVELQPQDIQANHARSQDALGAVQFVASGLQTDDYALDKSMKKSLKKTGLELVELHATINQLKKKNKNVEEMTRKLRDESNLIEERSMVLERRNQELEQTIKELEYEQEQNVDVARRYKELEELHSKLESRCNELEKDNSKLQKQMAETKDKNEALESESKKVKDENLECLQIYDEIFKRSNVLLDQNELLESRTKVLEERKLEFEVDQAKLENANKVLSHKCNILAENLCNLSSMMEEKEVKVRIINETTGRSSVVSVSKSHSLSLYDALYCNPRVRADRVRTWPIEIAEKVRSKRGKIVCTMLDGESAISQVFDIKELKRVSTSMLFQSSNSMKDIIDFVLRWKPLDENLTVTALHPLNAKPKGIRLTIMNGHSKCSRELYLPLSESLTIYESVYNHKGVRPVIRKWPRDLVWRVANGRSRIVCRASNGDNECAKYTLDDLASLTLRDLHEQACIGHMDQVLLLLMEERVVKEDELYRPFKARGFRQRGWIPTESQSRMTVRLKNETTQRSRDVLVPIRSDVSLFDAAYNRDEVLCANVRKWKSTFVKEVKNDLARLLCVFFGDGEAEIRTCSVQSLKTITTSEAKKNLSNADGSVSIVLRCVKTKKGVEAARHEEMRLRIVNHTTRRSMFLYIPYSQELTLYDSIYNKPEVRAAQVRMWPKEVLHAIKDKTATIQCHLYDGQASENELQVFTIEKLKETSTKRLFDLIPSSEDVPQLVLKYHSVGNEKTEILLHVSNDLTGRFKELEVPVSQDMTLYDIIYQSASIKFSYVRMWPSDRVQQVKNKTAEILCVMMGREHEITFSIEDMKKTTTSQLVELSPPPYDMIRLVLKFKETGNVAKERDPLEVKDVAIRITNHTTGRFRDFTVPLSEDLSLYRSIYNNRLVKAGKVRVWPSNLVQDLKQKVVEVECAILDANGGIIYTYTIRGMRDVSTKELFELAPISEKRINLLLRCESKAYTGNSSNRLRETFRPQGFRQHGWVPKSVSPSFIRVRIQNEMTRRSADFLISVSDLSASIQDAIYENSQVKRRGIRRWPASAAKGIKEGSSEVVCLYLGSDGSPTRKLTTKDLCETPVQALLEQSSILGRINLSLRCVATRVIVIDVDGDVTKSEADKSSLPGSLAVKTPNGKGKDEESTLDVALEDEMSTKKENMTHGYMSNGGNKSNMLGLYPQVFLSLGFKVTEKKRQTLGMYPAVRVALGFKPETLKVRGPSLGLYPENLASLRFDAIKKKMEKKLQEQSKKQKLDIHTEVHSSLGQKMVVPNVIKKSFGIYPEVVTSLGFEVLKTKNDVNLLGIYAEVVACLGFEVNGTITSSEICATHSGGSKGEDMSNGKENIGEDDLIQSYNDEMAVNNSTALNIQQKKNLGIYSEVLACLGFKVIHTIAPSKTDEVGSQEKSMGSESCMKLVNKPIVLESLSLSFKPTGFRQRGWLPQKPAVSQFRVRLMNEISGRWKDIIVPVSESLTLFDAVYNEESVQRANLRQFPSQIALEVKQKACEILADVFIPCYAPIDQKSSFFGDSSDLLVDDEGTAIRSFTLDDLHQTTTVEIFELMSQPRDAIKFVLRVQKVEAVDALESRVSTLEKQLLIASQQAKGGSELLAEKLKALDEATTWNKQLSGELEELRAGAFANGPSSPSGEIVTRAKQQTELLEQKEKALEQANGRNISLRFQVAQLQKEIEVLEVAASTSIMPEYKSVVDHVIEEEDDRDELSKDVSFKPIGFRQRGWRFNESASMDMRLRVTNETTQHSKDFVIAIDDQLTVFDAVYTEGSEEDILDKTSNIQCIVWHDLGKDIRTFSVSALKQMSTKRFFELTSRRQDLMKALIRCQETAKTQVQELESEVHVIGVRNEELQNSMCVLSNELAASMTKYNRLRRELDMLKQSQEGGLLFATELFEI